MIKNLKTHTERIYFFYYKRVTYIYKNKEEIFSKGLHIVFTI